MNSSDDQEQSLKAKDEARSHAKDTLGKVKWLINKPAVIFLVVVIFCSLSALVGYFVIYNNPKFKFIRAMSEKPEMFNQAVLIGSLDIEKYDLNTSRRFNNNVLVKDPDLSGTKISYDGQISFTPRKMMLRVCFDYNNRQYRSTAYMTDDKLILDTKDFFELYQINVPEKQKIKMPEYIYTGEEAISNIQELWSRLENTFNAANKSAQQLAIERLADFVIKSIPNNLFSKDDEGRIILSFDRLGLKEIIDCVVEEVWHNDESFALLISKSMIDDSTKDTEKIKKDILAAINNVSLDNAKENTSMVWRKFDQVMKLNSFSLALKNEEPDYNTSFYFDCNIEKSLDFPNGGKIALKGDSKITVNKAVDIILPYINEQNSIYIKDIKL